MVVRTNTFTYISNYNWDRLLECSKKADTDSTKSTCYRNALKQTYSTSTLSIDSLKIKLLIYERIFKNV